MAQVHPQSVLPRELRLQVVDLDNEPLALPPMLVAQSRKLPRIAIRKNKSFPWSVSQARVKDGVP
jgi:hypothetical protein